MFYDVIVIGGGAAGFFSAIHSQKPTYLLEKSNTLLAKVRISGGGRCNVTHSCFDPKSLITNYPRGSKELLGPFHYFGPQETINWFESRGVPLKIEADGRMFPSTDNSETIISSLMNEAKVAGVEIGLQKKITSIEKKGDLFYLKQKEGDPLTCKKLILATGSSPQGHKWAKEFGHNIVRTLPSLFTFNVPTSPLLDLSGVSAQDCIICLKGTKHKQRGPVLVTHFGFSGPAVIKLSAWAAPYLFDQKYKADLEINWLADENQLPKRLFKRLKSLEVDLACDTYKIEGKTTHKQEFVTCGGVDLKEVNFKNMESKLVPGLHFCGEILNIDGVTGGFNFQNAWTTGYLAGSS